MTTKDQIAAELAVYTRKQLIAELRRRGVNFRAALWSAIKTHQSQGYVVSESEVLIGRFLHKIDY